MDCPQVHWWDARNKHALPTALKTLLHGMSMRCMIQTGSSDCTKDFTAWTVHWCLSTRSACCHQLGVMLVVEGRNGWGVGGGGGGGMGYCNTPVSLSPFFLSMFMQQQNSNCTVWHTVLVWSTWLLAISFEHDLMWKVKITHNMCDAESALQTTTRVDIWYICILLDFSFHLPREPLNFNSIQFNFSFY